MKSEVSNFLKTKSIQIPIDNEWLTSCVECFKDQGNYSLREIKELVYQQWLLADLEDIAVQIIPESLFTCEKYTLKGRYAIQINYVVNVAMSFHKQIQKIRRPEATKNLEVDVEAQTGAPMKQESGNRMLKIEMTDGIRKFVGFEDNFIQSLREPFVPGMKAILIGPIQCFNSILFLKNHNITILGGEVDSLHIPNATENILARALKLPENPDPYSQHIATQPIQSSSNLVNNIDIDEEAMLMLAEEIEKEVPEIVNVHENLSRNANTSNFTSFEPTTSSRINNPPLHSEASSTSNSAKSEKTKSKDVNSSSRSVFCIPKAAAIDFDDDFDLLTAESLASIELSQVSGSTNAENLNSGVQDYEMFDSTCIKKNMIQMNDLKQKLTESYGNKPSVQGSTCDDYHSFNVREDGKIVVDYLSDTASPLIKLPLEPELGDPLPDSSPCSDPTQMFPIETFPPRKRPATVTAFARVVKVNKPKVKENKWSMSGLVEAKGIEVEVSFKSEVVEKVYGLSAAELSSKRKEMNADVELKAKINESLRKAHIRFAKLACEMTFHFSDAISDPLIIDIFITR